MIRENLFHKSKVLVTAITKIDIKAITNLEHTIMLLSGI